MKLTESIIHALGGVTKRDLDSKIREAVVNFPSLMGIDPDEDKYRRLSLAPPTRDLNSLAQDRMIQIAAYLYETNPIAGRLVELTRDFVVGEGIKVEGLHPEVDEVIRRHWEDPANEWELKLDQKVLELGLFGEQIWPVFVSENAGRVRLGCIDPVMVQEVIPDPENVEALIGMRLKGVGGRPGKQYRTVLDAEEAQILSSAGRALRNRFNDGQAFYFSVNRMSNGTRGRSDLLSVIDWLDGYEEMLYGAMENTDLLTAFIWDVTLDGMTEEQIREYARKQRPPKRGSVRYHNERAHWNAVAPDLKAQEIARHARTFLAHIAARRGFPVHWLTSADDVNVATAKEMGIPTLKTLSARQKTAVAIVRKVVRFVIHRAIDAGMLNEKVPILDADGNETEELKAADQCFRIMAPELSVRDLGALATAFSQMAASVAIAINSKLLSRETGIRVLASLAGMMGIEIDPQTEIAKAEAKSETQPDYSPERLENIRRQFAVGGER